MELSKNPKFKFVSRVTSSTSLQGVQVFVKSEFILESYVFLVVCADHAVHGHINFGTAPPGNKKLVVFESYYYGR